MKLIKDPEGQEEGAFKPFKITLEIESEGEARLLYHAINQPNLKQAIFERIRAYCSQQYIEDMPTTIRCQSVTEEIAKHARIYGPAHIDPDKEKKANAIPSYLLQKLKKEVEELK